MALQRRCIDFYSQKKNLFSHRVLIVADLQNKGKELWVISVNFRVLSTFLCVRVISCPLAGSHCVCKGCLSGGGWSRTG